MKGIKIRMRITNKQRNCPYCQEPFKERLYRNELNGNTYSSFRILYNSGDYLLNVRPIQQGTGFIQGSYSIPLKRCPWCDARLK